MMRARWEAPTKPEPVTAFVLGVIEFIFTLYLLIALCIGLDAWQEYRRCRELQLMFNATGEKATRSFCAQSLRIREDRKW